MNRGGAGSDDFIVDNNRINLAAPMSSSTPGQPGIRIFRLAQKTISLSPGRNAHRDAFA